MGHPVYGVSFSPDHLTTLREAFDEAWAEVEQTTAAADKEATRDRLASIIIALGEQGVMHPQLLKLCAKRMLRGERRSGPAATDASADPVKSSSS